MERKKPLRRALALPPVLLAALLPCATPAAPAVPADAVSVESLTLSVECEPGKTFRLEALIIKPKGPGPYPLALITHGSPREGSKRRQMTAWGLSSQARQFARRGYLAAVVMRRGYAGSTGDWDENFGRCDLPDYLGAARESAKDLRGVIQALRHRQDVDGSTVVAIGVSAGGMAVMALAADPPDGLKAAINFAGGRGSLKPDEVCDPDRLARAFGKLGKTSRIPTLWIYAENDHYFSPAIVKRNLAAFTDAGGVAEFVGTGPFGKDGHALFRSKLGVPIWQPSVDAFLKRLGLPTWDTPPAEPPVAQLSAPSGLSASGEAAWQEFLEGSDNKAFALAPSGRFGWRSGRSTVEEARTEALAHCDQRDCRIVSENDRLVESPARH